MPCTLSMRMKQAVQTLNKYYGDKRDPVADLGGYVLYIDNHRKWLELEQEYSLDRLPPEYIEEIENDNLKEDNHRYYEVLYILSSDYGIYVFISEEIEKMIKNR